MTRVYWAVLIMLMVGALVASVASGAMMERAAKKELDTAIFHAKLAAGYNNTTEIELHLHHVVNCIEGKSGKDYFQASGDVCQGMGNGLSADLKDSGMAGAHALPYTEIADQVALWGVAQGMRKDVGRARAAADAARRILELAKANFK